MKNEKIQKKSDITFLPQTKVSDLRGKQSVRATFKLSQKTINAMSIVSVHLGIKQKSLFDHLMGDAEILGLIARDFQPCTPESKKCIQKTYVLSRQTLSLLDMISKKCKAPRDLLVEYSIKRLLPVIAKEQEKHEKRKEVLQELVRHLKQSEKLLEKTEKMLGTEDPVYNELKTAISRLKNSCTDIESFIEKGKLIEEF